jgi:hypothetical protein
LRVRIRSILADRCIPCHHENGRHETARFIPLDSYDQLAPRLAPEAPDFRRWWVVSALGGLVPLALLFSVSFWQTNHRAKTRQLILAVTGVTLGIMLACWLVGRPGAWYGPAIAASATVGAAAVAVQAIASIRELLEA